MITTIVLIGLLVLVAVVALWFISTQRELVNLDEKCSNALSQIEVQMNSRWDALFRASLTNKERHGMHPFQVLFTNLDCNCCHNPLDSRGNLTEI